MKLKSAVIKNYRGIKEETLAHFRISIVLWVKMMWGNLLY